MFLIVRVSYLNKDLHTIRRICKQDFVVLTYNPTSVYQSRLSKKSMWKKKEKKENVNNDQSNKREVLNWTYDIS